MSHSIRKPSFQHSFFQSLAHFFSKTAPLRQKIFLLMGPLSAIYMLTSVDLVPGNSTVTRAAAVAIWMAIWWLTEAAPLAITSLLPVVLFPALQVMTGKEVTPQYMNSIVFLFFGVFIIAIAMEKWRLNNRIALAIIELIGVSPWRLMLGFITATTFLSMWLNNMAVTMMMVPTALAVLQKFDELKDPDQQKMVRKFGIGLLLSIAFSASVGGMATLVGTAPNVVFVRVFELSFPNAPEITFSQWMLFAMPYTIMMSFIIWAALGFMYCPKKGSVSIDSKIFESDRKNLGPMGFSEKAVLWVSSIAALLLVSRSNLVLGDLTIPGWGTFFSTLSPDGSLIKFVDDGTVVMTAAVALFLIPSRSQDSPKILSWGDLEKLPWDVIFLIGGGFALAAGMMSSGLSQWIGLQLNGIVGMPPVSMVLFISTVVVLMTSLISNTATTQMLLPILAAVAVATNINPLLLMIPATMAASCAFMLPVSTPPNAVVFGTQRVSILQMATSGVLINILGLILLTGMLFLMGQWMFNIDVNQAPAWAQTLAK